ncbi:hypothetical protein ACH42_11790 [Endozoicomonas sp. (ex Bugula neritina AB1)]|nr:hypothetical protein ACH42_11790 [Endozoicomonas sp. (ex Bugula neritina AB1)]
MTILRELAIYLTLLLILMFAGSLALTVRDARNYQQVQLKSQAQDTATSLGVAIAATEPGNIAVIDSMIDAVFDRGYYRQIQFTDIEGVIQVNSEHPVDMQGIPSWFIRLVNLHSPTVTTEINSGWMPVGTLSVTSHPGTAYRSLWFKTRSSILLFGSGLLIAIFGLTLMLGIVLRPLGRLEKQANAICQRKFEVQTQIPKTRDLKRVVEAMNRMATKLDKLFNEKVLLTEELRRTSVKDTLTGVLHRRAFEDRVASLFDQEQGEAGGSLLMVKVGGLEALNQTQGEKVTNGLLVDISRQIGQTMSAWPQAFVGRRNGSEFSVFVPACAIEENHRVTEQLFRVLVSIHHFGTHEGSNCLHITSVTHLGRCQPKELFEHADQLMRGLQINVGNSWKAEDITCHESLSYMQWSEDQWLSELKNVLLEQKIQLFAQQVFNHEQQPVFREVFARLQLQETLASAEAFLPMVERFDLHSEFDKAVIKTLIEHMTLTSENNKYCVNLSPRSLLDDDFYLWLLNTLQQQPKMARRMILETPERTLLLAGDQLADKVDKLVKTGCQFSIDHFGIASQTMSSLHTLNLHYVKVDGSFIRDIENNHGNQLYIRTLAMLAGARDIELFAQGVETHEEWLQLQQIGVKGGQGYYLGRPSQL